MDKKNKKKEKKKINKLLNKEKIENINVNRPCLAGAIMVKNESARIHVTLESIKGICDKVIILDTGSTDGTQNLIMKWCEENKMKLHMKEGKFEDFSKSRNVLLDFSDDK